jgi:hypothetical protein
MYIVKELWCGRSARDQSLKDTGRKMWRAVNELMLLRYVPFMLNYKTSDCLADSYLGYYSID